MSSSSDRTRITAHVVGGYAAYADTNEASVLTRMDQGMTDLREVVPFGIQGVKYPSFDNVTFLLFW